jgi:hypothetical protein
MKILPTVGALAAAPLLFSCVRAETTQLGKQYPGRGAGCAVEVLPDTPAGPVENIATSEASCHVFKGRSACIEKLKAEACEVGADLVYGFREGKKGEYHHITATLARAAEPASAPPSEQQAADGCTPPCSPGYACHAGKCTAECNPPCSPGYACADDRTCKAEEGTGPTTSAR